MGGLADHRQPALARLRHLLRLARRIPDVADVFPLGPVRVGEPNAQRGASVPVGPVAAARLAAHSGGLHPDADRALSILSGDRKSTRLNSSHVEISYAVFCLKK